MHRSITIKAIKANATFHDYLIPVPEVTGQQNHFSSSNLKMNAGVFN
jgi:hypothetical protein